MGYSKFVLVSILTVVLSIVIRFFLEGCFAIVAVLLLAAGVLLIACPRPLRFGFGLWLGSSAIWSLIVFAGLLFEQISYPNDPMAHAAGIGAGALIFFGMIALNPACYWFGTRFQISKVSGR